MSKSVFYILMILICMAVTFSERLLPFLVFRSGKTPKIVAYLGNVLPMAVIATLIIYCVRNTNFSSAGGFVPQLAACGVTAALHWRFRKSYLSIIAGTAVYMVLLRMLG